MIGRVIKSEKYLLISFFLTGIISRLLFLEKYQTHWDGPTWSFALTHFSFAQYAPSPPGYPIYVAFGKLFHFYIPDPHLSMLMVSVLFAGIGAAVFFIIGTIIFNRTVGIIVSLLFLSASTTFYFGITVNPYGILPITASVLACLVYLICLKKSKNGIWLALVYSFAVGIRPQDAIFLTGLALYGFIYLGTRQKIEAVITFIISFFVWFIPLANAVGGINTYIADTISFSKSGAVSSLAITHGLTGWIILLKGYVQTFGIASIFPLYYLSKLRYYKKNFKSYLKPQYRVLVIVFILWIVPAFLFNAIVRSDHAAHQMTYLAAFLFLAAYAIWRVSKNNKKILLVLVTLIVFYNLFAFFRDRDPGDTMPYVSQSYHYSEIVKNNIRTPAIITYVSHFPASSTVILSDSEIFRQLMYYLKTYHIYSYEVLETNGYLMNTVDSGYEWNFAMEQNHDNQLKLNNNDKIIIYIPNNRPAIFNGIKVQKVILAGNALLYIFPVEKNVKYKLSLHKLTADK